jgi:hypothetical protein
MTANGARVKCNTGDTCGLGDLIDLFLFFWNLNTYLFPGHSCFDLGVCVGGGRSVDGEQMFTAVSCSANSDCSRVLNRFGKALGTMGQCRRENRSKVCILDVDVSYLGTAKCSQKSVVLFSDDNIQDEP